MPPAAPAFVGVDVAKAEAPGNVAAKRCASEKRAF